jgi:hypothetical protein
MSKMTPSRIIPFIIYIIPIGGHIDVKRIEGRFELVEKT